MRKPKIPGLPGLLGLPTPGTVPDLGKLNLEESRGVPGILPGTRDYIVDPPGEPTGMSNPGHTPINLYTLVRHYLRDAPSPVQ